MINDNTFESAYKGSYLKNRKMHYIQYNENFLTNFTVVKDFNIKNVSDVYKYI